MLNLGISKNPKIYIFGTNILNKNRESLRTFSSILRFFQIFFFVFFQASELLAFIEDMSQILNLLLSQLSKSAEDSSNSTLAQSLLHDLVFTGESKKSCLHKKPEIDPELDLDGVERWMVMNAPLFDKIMQHGLAQSFGLPLEPSLVPTTEINLAGDKSNTKLRPLEVVFLNAAIPHEYRSQWRLLFHSR